MLHLIHEEGNVSKAMLETSVSLMSPGMATDAALLCFKTS